MGQFRYLMVSETIKKEWSYFKEWGGIPEKSQKIGAEMLMGNHPFLGFAAITLFGF